MLVMPALGRLRQDDQESEVSLGYMLCLQINVQQIKG